jgi:hypothetical protein
MVKICCGHFSQKILLLIKIYTCGQFNQEILLLVKIYTINLLIKIYMRAVRSRDIVAGKNLHDHLFIKTSISTFVYRQHINTLERKT